MSTPEDIVRRLNSEDCELATGLCLREYKERDCWICILKEYTNEVYNQALEDAKDFFMKHIFDNQNKHVMRNYVCEHLEQMKR